HVLSRVSASGHVLTTRRCGCRSSSLSISSNRYSLEDEGAFLLLTRLERMVTLNRNDRKELEKCMGYRRIHVLNKWMAILIAGLMAAVASGCTVDSNPEAVNTSTVSDSKNNKGSNTNATASNQNLPKAEELIQRMDEAGKELMSFSAEVDVYQTIINRVSDTASTEQIIDS